MRMWYGSEKEGECDDITLFVQTHFLSDERVRQVRKAANDYNVSRIYLGAGRIDLEGITDYSLDILRVMSSSFKIVVETTAAFVDIAEKLDGIADEIILRYEVPNLTRPRKSRLTLKVDNIYNWCAVAGRLIATDITGLKDGLYPQDKEIKV